MSPAAVMTVTAADVLRNRRTRTSTRRAPCRGQEDKASTAPPISSALPSAASLRTLSTAPSLPDCSMLADTKHAPSAAQSARNDGNDSEDLFADSSNEEWPAKKLSKF